MTDAPFGRAGKRPPAVLRLWARAKAIPGEARLALNRFPTRCIRHYYLDRVLGLGRKIWPEKERLPKRDLCFLRKAVDG